MFCFIHDIGHGQLQRISSHVDENMDSIKSRGHGNKAKLPHNTTEFPEIEHIRDFILNTGRVRGMPLPGRLPGLRETEAYYLSADETQTEVHKQYKEAAERENRIPVKSSTFHSFWHDLVPNVKILSPSTDLCDVCQENSKKLVYSGHLSEEEKRERHEDSLAHLNAAKVEREYYNRQIISARDGPRESHISFDYAQQIHYPYNCQQVGSTFFKTPRKCGIFGICEEQRWQQVIFCKSKSSHKSFPCKSKSSHKSFPCKSKSSHKSFGQTSSQVKSQVIWSKHKSSHKSLCPSSLQVKSHIISYTPVIRRGI